MALGGNRFVVTELKWSDGWYCSGPCFEATYAGRIFYCPKPYYRANCGLVVDYHEYYRNVTTYTCTGCGDSTTYYHAASSGYCNTCGSVHSVPESGSANL